MLVAGPALVATLAVPAHAAGTRFAIVATTSSQWHWTLSPEGTDAYPPGAWFTRIGDDPTWRSSSQRDLAFRTYVEAVDADLSVSVTGPATAKAKGLVTYIITVANAGPVTAVAATMTSRLPFGVQYTNYTAPSGVTCTPPGKGVVNVTCALGDLAAGSSSTQGLTVKIMAKPGQSNINNVVTVSSSSRDPNLSNNSASYSTAVTR